MLHGRRVVIVAGGEIQATDLKQIDPKHDWIIAADGGAANLIQYKIWPNLLVGDMDTLQKEELEIYIQRDMDMDRLPVEKDVTDTHYACEKALQYQPKEVVLLGVWGGARIDHALANIGLLEWFVDRNIPAMIIAGSNRIRMLKGPTKVELKKEHFHYLSLLPVSEKVTGIDTVGLKYTLKNDFLKRGLTRGMSNEWMDEQAVIRIQQGKLLIIETSD